ncbi:ABC transporter substrate-binding protein [Candidatus Binatia bacterium]|nr:ABC transporter substrate-binding protein [Candidatus Binatia bacterium]
MKKTSIRSRTDRALRAPARSAPRAANGGGGRLYCRVALGAAFLLALVNGGLPARSSAALSPQEVVDETSTRVVSILSNNGLSSEEKRKQIEDIVYQQVDFETLSRLVLAQNWKRLSAAQQEEFMQEFRKHLSVTYGRNIDSYKNERVQIVGGREEARGDYTVLSRIVRGGGSQDIVVDYRLRQREGQWRIIDIIVEGVSLVSNFRSQFQDIIAQGGPQRLIDLLREKNQKGEPLKEEAPIGGHRPS